MIQVSLHEAKTHLSSLIQSVEKKKDKIIILRHGIPVAEINPIKNGKRSLLHKEIKDIQINYDPLIPTEREWDNV